MSSTDRILPPTFSELRPNDPQQVGTYRLIGRLGTGGMGSAFLAESGNQWVVVKVLHDHLAEDPEFRARLRRELDALQKVGGIGAVRVVNQDLECATPWFAMEFVEGQTLADRVRTAGPLTGNTLENFARELAERIQAIHKAGITHRDIKPSNIVISPMGPRIIDFGIAAIDERTAMTSTGVLVGTLGWASPEQVAGDDVNNAADVHAWGLCVLYAATGEAPFAADTSASMVYKVVHMQPDVPETLPGGLSPLVAAALRKDPAARPSLQDIVEGRAQAPRNTPSLPITPSGETRIEPRKKSAGLIIGVLVGLLIAIGVGSAAFAFIRSQSSTAGAPDPVQVTVTASAPAPGTAATEPADTAPTTPNVDATSAPAPTPEIEPPVGYEEQKVANALLNRMNKGEWQSVPELCNPQSLCTRQFVDFFEPRFRSGQFLRGDVGMLYSCAEPVPGGWEGGCSSPKRWLAGFDWTCSKNGSTGVQREVGYFTFDYSQGTRISDFDAVTMIEPASQCTS